MDRDVLNSGIADKVLRFDRRFEALSFENSPAWRAIQGEALAAITKPVLNDNSQRIAEMFTKNIALAIPAEKMAALFQPAVEQMTAPFQTLIEDIRRTAAVNVAERIKLPDLAATFQFDRAIGSAFQNHMAERLRFALGGEVELARWWEPLLRDLPPLDYEETEAEPLAVAQAPISVFITREDLIHFIQAFWVFFTFAQLATPEGRGLLDDYAVIWGLTTALVLRLR